jgi:membrane-associated protease RseP (regulator of RpoE activity)
VSELPPLWVYPPQPPPPPPPKFQHGWAIPLALFVLTAISTSLFTGGGPMYSIAILMILGAHEFGHYFACRWHDVDCTLPFFIPAPFLPFTGTLGAVIRIKEPFPSRKALFDVGVAGPIAGFVTLVPFLIVGIYWSRVDVAPPPSPDLVYFGEPLLLNWIADLVHGPRLPGTDLFIHPVAFGAWFGMLATAINLLPFGQLDGGHIAYAVFGPRARWIGMATLALMLVLVWFSYSWIVMAVMLLVMTWFMGFRHPAPLDDFTPLGPGRVLVAVLALAILVACFTPTPIVIDF